MNLLHVINDLEIGGAQKLVHDLLLLQQKDPDLNVSCFVFKTTGSSLEKNLLANGVKIISADSSPFSLSSAKTLCSLMKKADVVHAHLFPSNYITAMLKSFSGAKIIFTEHSTHNRRRDHKFLRPLERLVYSRFDKIACISEATASNLSEWIGKDIAKSRIEIIENGIDLKKFNQAEAQEPKSIFGRAGVPLLMVSRFTASKDHATVVRALSHIDNPEVFVAFVGDGDLRQEIEDLAESMRVKDRVIFLGTRTDTPELIRSASIGIQSSNWEGFGLTAVEIMAGGKPVIASEVNGLKEVVEGAGLLFPKGDEKALAKQIMSVLTDECLYGGLLAKGLKRAEKYSIRQTAEKYKDIYLPLRLRLS